MKDREYRGDFEQWADDQKTYGDTVLGSYGGNCPTEEPRYVFAEYQTPSYEGYSTVITSSDGRKFEVVEGSHCSCYGLEGQWEPTEHTKDEIEKMMGATYGFFHDHRDELGKWLKHITR